MATISVTVFVDNNEVNVVNGGVSGSRIDVEEGDVLSIFHNAFLSTGGSITASGFDTSRWTSSSNLVIAEGATGTRTIKSNPTNGAENITLSESGSP